MDVLVGVVSSASHASDCWRRRDCSSGGIAGRRIINQVCVFYYNMDRVANLFWTMPCMCVFAPRLDKHLLTQPEQQLQLTDVALRVGGCLTDAAALQDVASELSQLGQHLA